MLKLIINNETGYIDNEYMSSLSSLKSIVGSSAIEIDWYAEVKNSIDARFGDQLPVHFRTTMNKEQKYPYMYGDVHNPQYPEYKKNRGRYYNTPFPVPCKVKSSVKHIGLTYKHGDPLMWMDFKYRCTYNHIIARQNKSLHIQTRSDLIAHDDYINVLDKKNHSIEIVISNLNDDETRMMEPGAPSNGRRIEAYNKLKSMGFNVKLTKQVELKVSA